MKKLLATRWSGKEVMKAVTSLLGKGATHKIFVTTRLGEGVKKKF
jgi:phosphopantetheinyl transferase (holo-ACP synthase)